MKRRRRIACRMMRIMCGRRLPQTWNTVLVLLSVHMYLTVPVMLAAGITDHMTGSDFMCLNCEMGQYRTGTIYVSKT